LYKGNAYIAFYLQNNKYTINNIIFLMILFSITIIILNYICKKDNSRYFKIFFFCLLYHTAMSILFYNWQSWPPTDAGGFFKEAILANNAFELILQPRKYVGLFLYPFVNIMKLSFFSGFMLFNVIGFFALIIFFMTILEQIKGNLKAEKLLIFILFLPGLNYWTCSISKESINLFGISIVLYALVNLNKRMKYLLIGLLLLAPVRPYIFIMVLFALMLALMVTKSVSLGKKILLMIIIIMVSIPAFHIFKTTIQMEKVDIESAKEYMDARSAGWRGGSSIDLQNYSIPLRFFTFLYRPLFFDAHSSFMILASLENIIYLIITLQMFSFKFIRFLRKEKNIFIMFNLMFFLTAGFFLSYTEGNLGTAMRHKTVIMPSLLAIYILYKAKYELEPVPSPKKVKYKYA
jgi:hypothetical protein